MNDKGRVSAVSDFLNQHGRIDKNWVKNWKYFFKNIDKIFLN